ncbi:MAG: Rieske 2Fe-2S domain-containing protein [Candidatus Tectomicrobia bacterium]|uniref:Rieske 2Fe-2S domain-containing protein n=1 Tax=Tectimicrobiota bacterium TaxID=2528274 RepID=A0A932GQD5_UNCTE|nr:Rieske 2Fe-2S domain-containing protein [Candidatus Tectomicrobia bacterium]
MEKRKPSCSRRKILQGFGAAGTAGLILGSSYVSLNFFSPKALYDPPNRFRAGKPDDFLNSKVTEIWKESQKIWLVRSASGLHALVAVCTHLGCTPNWFPEEEKFKCPCHGSVFNLKGDVVSGPAPEPLFRTPIVLNEKGDLIVGTGNLGIRLPEQSNREPQRSGEGFLIRV